GVYLVIRNWGGITAWFKRTWEGLRKTFVEGAQNVWNALPQWLRMIFRGVAFAVKFSPIGLAGQAGQAVARAVGGQSRPNAGSARPNAAVGGRQAADANVKGRIDIAVSPDGQARVK